VERRCKDDRYVGKKTGKTGPRVVGDIRRKKGMERGKWKKRDSEKFQWIGREKIRGGENFLVSSMPMGGEHEKRNVYD